MPLYAGARGRAPAEAGTGGGDRPRLSRGSGWKDYQATGSLCGIRLPAGLRQAERLPAPIFTPSTKAAVGDHDQNVSFEAV